MKNSTRFRADFHTTLAVIKKAKGWDDKTTGMFVDLCNKSNIIEFVNGVATLTSANQFNKISELVKEFEKQNPANDQDSS